MKITGLKDNFATSFEVMHDRLGLDKFDVEMAFENAKEMTVGVKGGKGYIRCSEEIVGGMCATDYAKHVVI